MDSKTNIFGIKNPHILYQGQMLEVTVRICDLLFDLFKDQL